MGTALKRWLFLLSLGLVFWVGPVYGQSPSLNNLFFEEPQLLVQDHVRFPQSYQIGNLIYLVYQRILPATESVGGTIVVEFQTSTDGFQWSTPRQVGSGIRYSGELPPPIYSLTKNAENQGIIAIGEDAQTIRIYQLNNEQRETGFTPIASLTANQTLVSPSIVSRPDGGYFLFITQDIAGRPSLQYSSSLNGRTWSPITEFTTNPATILTFNPTYGFVNGQHWVLYQGVLPGLSNLYQIFLQTSSDGINWSQPRVVTDQSDELDFTLNPENYDNQRPRLALIGNRPYLVWERRTQARNIQIYGSFLTQSGSISDFPEPVSNRGIGAGNPQITEYQGLPLVSYFDIPSGNSRLITALRRVNGWQYRTISTNPGVNTFSSYVWIGERFHVFWQNRTGTGSTTARIFYRQPDQRANPPQILPLNYQLGRRSNEEQILYRIAPPPDPSGIVGFSFSWSQDPQVKPPTAQVLPIDDGTITVPAGVDGEWFFSSRVIDGAGNWSEPSQVLYYLDSTPPEPVVFRFPALDETGYLASNTINLSWLPSSDEELAGYSVNLRYLGQENAALPVTSVPLPANFGSTIQSQTQISRQNLDNGLWALTVSAVDAVGNVSDPNTLYFRLNKYIPVTRLTNLRVRENILGQRELAFSGRGFTANGVIERIVLDQDGQEPWDYEFIQNQDYRISNDVSMGDLLIRDIRSGTYQVLLFHGERGWYRSGERLVLEDSGTVRFGNYTVYDPYQAAVYKANWVFRYLNNQIFYWLTLVLLGVTMLLSIHRLQKVLRDSRMLRLQARAILYRLPRTHGKIRSVARMRKQGISLGIKFTVLIVLLVSSVVLLIALPLRTYFLTSQQQTLARGLEERVGVLIESIATGAGNFLPTVETSTIELSQLILQSQVMDEAEFVTVTAFGTRGQDVETVWATTDPFLLQTATIPENISSQDEFYFNRSISGEYIPGNYELFDVLTENIPEIQSRIDQEARSRVGDIPDQLNTLLSEAISLVLDNSAEGIIRRREIDSTIRGLNERLDQILREIAGSFQSFPTYTSENYDPSQNYYLFYKPVVFRSAQAAGERARYYQGMVRMGVSTELINRQIGETAAVIQNNIIVFSLLAVIAGIAGAALLSLITVMPIRKLVQAVETIRDTEDKSKLHDFKIPIRSRDELYVLSDVIQQMTYGLAKGAEKDKELLFGKDVQKMFISLDVGKNNVKTTTGHMKTDFSEFFGYYEGAKGVSGDYFYYQKITQDTYAMIKCDISGKGISAALIMVEVATLFLNHFSDWEKKRIQHLRVSKALKEPVQQQQVLSELVYNINNLIAERQFSGKFAALNIILFNEQTGELTHCNAGDNQVFTFRKKQGKLVQSTLHQSPASGMFNSKDFPIEFKEEKDHLESGDVLMLFTDGMEESQRKYLNPDGSVHVLVQDDLDQGRVPKHYLVDSDNEELGLERIHQIINAIENRQVLEIRKNICPYDKEPIVFDFTEVENSPENTVLAVVAVEKIWRLIPNPNAGIDDKITIDKKIDDFLRVTLQQYMTYFHSPMPEDSESLYRQYSGIQEDEQYDDLTILAVKKL